MKFAAQILVSLGLAGQAFAERSPVSKVVQLLSDLQAKVTSDGEESKKLYTEYAAWCEDRAANLNFEIKTGTAQVEELQATIDQQVASTQALTSKVEALTSDIATKEADLKAASQVRATEASDFATEEKELVSVIDSLKRAIGILEREMRQGGAAMLQLQHAAGVTEALTIMVQASMLNSADAHRLTALVQSSQGQSDDDSELTLGAPAAAVYTSSSGTLVSTLEGLRDTAEAQLAEARKSETKSLHNFELLKQSLDDGIKFASKDLDRAKAGLAAAGEKKSAAEGELSVTSRDLAEDKASLEAVTHDCSARAQDYEAEVKSREEELKVLAQAKQVVADSTGGAERHAYGLSQVALLQLGRSSSHFAVLRFVRGLAQKFSAPALAQLAERLATATEAAARSGADPFAKVKGLISDVIARLEAAATADASHKAFCDKELAETHANQEAKSTSVSKLSTKIDQMSARSAQLKQEVAALESELAALVKSQTEAMLQRQKEHEAFLTEKANLEQGVQGVKLALKVLRDYYGKADKAHAAGDGAATGIIGLLEVVESDFTKSLAEVVAAEESAQASYDAQTKENEVEKTTKEQDVKYKSAESTNLDKAVAETASDRTSVQAELDAVLEYLAKLEEQCVGKAEPYEQRAQRRADEINGLKQALDILEGEAVLLQRSSRKRQLRGVPLHAAFP